MFEWKAKDGINRIWAYKQLRLKDNSPPYLYISVGHPKDPIIHKANLHMLGNLSILGIATLLVLSLAWVFWNLVFIKPINRLVAATQQFGMGEMDTRTGMPHTPDELGRLAQAFDDMASLLETRNIEQEKAEEALNKAYAEMEERVKERTAELTASTAALRVEISERKQADETLRSTRGYLENVFASSADAIGIVDHDGNFNHWNTAAQELYGYTFEELKGKPSSALYADSRQRELMLTELRRHDFIRNYEINMKKKDGSVFPCSLSIRKVRDNSNQVISSITVARDLTETNQTMTQLKNVIDQHEQARQALLESEQKLANIIDFLPYATFVIDTKGKVIAWNKAIEDMTGVKAQDMVGKDNYEYALPFYEKRRPILIDLVLEPEKGIKQYYEVKREDQALTAVAHFPNFRGKETYLLGKASALIDSLAILSVR